MTRHGSRLRKMLAFAAVGYLCVVTVSASQREGSTTAEPSASGESPRPQVEESRRIAVLSKARSIVRPPAAAPRIAQ